MTPIIETVSIDFSYHPEKKILVDINITIYKRQLITLLGPNGAGKSSLLNCIVGLLRPQKGMVMLNGQNINNLSRKIIAQSVAYVPQKSEVSFDYSVIEFVVMGRTAHMGVFSTPSNEDYRIAENALERLGIKELQMRPISDLSGGEQQKACIARAIAQEPKFIILDEPTSALDFGNQIRVLKLIRQLADSGYAVLVTTHNPEHPLLLNSDVWLLGKDCILQKGSVDEMIQENKLYDLYKTEICISSIGTGGRKVCFIKSLGTEKS
jgi:iron complex transport system ATP-binding protein